MAESFTKTLPITELNPDEIGNAIGLNEPRYRTDQIVEWLYLRGASSFDEMSNVPKNIREKLAKFYHVPYPRIVDRAVSLRDGTTKYLLKLYDGKLVETVYLPGDDHDTVCISTQVGCAMGCDFCATAQLGFERDLTVYEIMVQFLVVKKEHPKRNLRNAVLMGQGEPLYNYENVIGAIEKLYNYHEVGGRRVTLSTVGVVPGIRRLADESVRCKLAVSLNSGKQGTREKIMPIAKKYDLKSLTEALDYYYKKQKRRPTLEYILMKGVNDTIDEARALVNMSKRVPCKINLILFNPWPGASYSPPDGSVVDAFMQEAARGPMALTFREARGIDIAAACGTLARRKLSENQENA